MAQKTSITSSNVDLRVGSTAQFRSGDLSDVARLLRKEEAIGKRLKSVLDANGGLERAIKVHESGIGDERANIVYQLTELLREMTYKFHHFAEDKLERWKFRNNDIAQHTVQQMVQRYEQVEEEGLTLKRMLDGIEAIANGYQAHASEMEEVLLGIEAASQAHEQSMNAAIDQVAAETRRKQTTREAADQRTRQLTAEIDGFVTQSAELRAGQREVAGKVERLRRMANSQQEQANAMAEWEGVLVDMGNRQIYFKKVAEQQVTLAKARDRNSRLEMLLQQLQSEEEVVRAQENALNRASKATGSAKQRSACKKRA